MKSSRKREGPVDTGEKKMSRKQGIGYALQTLLIVQMLFVKIAVVPDDGTDIFALLVLARLWESFENPGILDFAAALGIFCLLCRYGGRERQYGWRLNVLALLFSVLYTLCGSFESLGSSAFLFANAYQRILAAFYILGFFLLFRLLLTVAYDALCNCVPHEEALPRRLWLRCFLILLLCWLPWLLTSYPATFCPDSREQLRQYLGIHPWTIWSVPLSTAIMGLCVSLGELIRNRNFGAFLYVCLQTFTGAAVISALLVQLRRAGSGRGWMIAALLFYTVLPVWGVYAQWLEKDFLYVQLYVAAILMLMQVQSAGACSGKQGAAVFCTLALAALLRNNGGYELFPYALLLVLLLHGAERRRLMMGVGAALVLVLGMNHVLYPALGMRATPVSEALSVPFQQTARYVVTVPEEVTEEERAVIDAVLDYDGLAETYMPHISDPVKEGYHGDEAALRAYFRVWRSMGKKHPSIYFDAFVHQAYGYLAPVLTFCEPNFSLYEKGGFREEEDLGLSRSTKVIPAVLHSLYWKVMQRLPLVKLLLTSGFYTWLVLACFCLLRIRGRRADLLPLIPGLINIGACVMSALHASIRYDLATIALAQLLLWWTAWHAAKTGPD